MKPIQNFRRSLLSVIGLMLMGSIAQAHKASDSYLQLEAAATHLGVRWDIALRDLDVAIDLDANEDGNLTWGEVKSAWPRLQAYALANMAIAGCVLHPTGQTLERRNDGAYAVIFLQSDCTLPQAPAITYTLFREVDPTHRGIARIQRPGQAVGLSMLDPTRPAGLNAISDASIPMSSTRFSASGSWAFLREGVRHILTGYDHVLFLLCLLLPSVMQRTRKGWRPVSKLADAVWPVVGIISAFTVAHSITLGLSAMKLVSLPPAFIEPAIAITIILAALDNIWHIFPVRRVIVTFFFGLIHGFGFADVLAELNLPTWKFAAALLQFNVGLELGQLLIVVSVTAALFLMRQQASYRVWVVRGGSTVAMLVAAVWLVERTANVKILPF
jgi:HupE / UreJ protein